MAHGFSMILHPGKDKYRVIVCRGCARRQASPAPTAEHGHRSGEHRVTWKGYRLFRSIMTSIRLSARGGEVSAMPVHDWTRVDAGIFHHFHHGWIEEIARALNRGILPADYYALAEQHAAGYGPDVLTLQEDRDADGDGGAGAGLVSKGTAVSLAAPKLQPTAETDLAFYRRKQSSPFVMSAVMTSSPWSRLYPQATRLAAIPCGPLLRRRPTC
jgi:hypothetical protein